MHGERGEGAAQANRSCHAPGEREVRHARLQSVEGERIRDDVGRHAERIAAVVEPHRTVDLAGGTPAVAMPQRAAELGVLKRAGESARRG